MIMPPSPNRVVIMVAAALLPSDQRAVRREQWLADLQGCAELDIPSHQISLGALAVALRTPRKGTVMLPIGPLALGMRLFRTPAGVPLAIALSLLLLIGIGLLLVP